MDTKRTKKTRVLIWLLIGIVTFFVAGIAFGLLRDYIDGKQATSSSYGVQKSTTDLIAEARAMETEINNKKPAYYDCVHTSDDFVIIEQVQNLYEQPEFSFEKDSPAKLSKIIERLAKEKCSAKIAAFEKLYKDYVEIDERIFNETHSTQIAASRFEMRLFTLQGEAEEKGKFLITKREILAGL